MYPSGASDIGGEMEKSPEETAAAAAENAVDPSAEMGTPAADAAEEAAAAEP